MKEINRVLAEKGHLARGSQGISFQETSGLRAGELVGTASTKALRLVYTMH